MNCLSGIRQLVADMRAGSETPNHYFQELQRQVHRDLALEAAEAGASLNRIVSARLSR